MKNTFGSIIFRTTTAFVFILILFQFETGRSQLRCQNLFTVPNSTPNPRKNSTDFSFTKKWLEQLVLFIPIKQRESFLSGIYHRLHGKPPHLELDPSGQFLHSHGLVIDANTLKTLHGPPNEGPEFHPITDYHSYKNENYVVRQYEYPFRFEIIERHSNNRVFEDRISNAKSLIVSNVTSKIFFIDNTNKLRTIEIENDKIYRDRNLEAFSHFKIVKMNLDPSEKHLILVSNQGQIEVVDSQSMKSTISSKLPQIPDLRPSALHHNRFYCYVYEGHYVVWDLVKNAKLAELPQDLSLFQPFVPIVTKDGEQVIHKPNDRQIQIIDLVNNRTKTYGSFGSITGIVSSDSNQMLIVNRTEEHTDTATGDTQVRFLPSLFIDLKSLKEFPSENQYVGEVRKTMQLSDNNIQLLFSINSGVFKVDWGQRQLQHIEEIDIDGHNGIVFSKDRRFMWVLKINGARSRSGDLSAALEKYSLGVPSNNQEP